MKRPGFFRSLSGKLVLQFLVIALLLSAVAGIGFRAAFHTHFEENIGPHILQYLEYMQADIGIPPDQERAAQLAARLPVEIGILGPKGAWFSDGQSVDPATIEPRHHFYKNGTEYTLGERAGRRYLVTRRGEYTLLFSLPYLRERTEWRGLQGLGMLLLVLVALYAATRRLFAPIKTIHEGVERFGAGDLTHRIEIRRRDELGSLATSINAMADEIQRMLDAKRQLLLAISHELRSPLTRAKVSVELLTDPRQQQELNRDLDEMEKLIEELLETERLSTDHQVLHKRMLSLNTLICELVETQFHDQQIALELPNGEIELSADAPRLRLLLKNLLENALRHTPEQTQPPRLNLSAEENRVTILVRDFGVGIEEQHLPHLMEPFYRVDPARQRETGGYGLGLYLCRMIAEAHGGTLAIASTAGKGTTITITLPVPEAG